MKLSEQLPDNTNYSDLFLSNIVIGSHARNENSIYSKFETISIEPLVKDGIIVDYVITDNPSGEKFFLSNLKNWELILDSYTLDSKKRHLLESAKRWVVEHCRQKILISLRQKVLKSYTGITSGGLYKYNGVNLWQYDVDSEMYFINDTSIKSVKYTYLRFFQNILLYIIISRTSLSKSYFEISPSIDDKVDLLITFGILDRDFALKFLKTYRCILGIYHKGVELYNNSKNKDYMEYTVAGSREKLLEANQIALTLLSYLGEEY